MDQSATQQTTDNGRRATETSLLHLIDTFGKGSVTGMLWTARTLTVIFRPFYWPLVGIVILFWFTYLSLLPMAYKMSIVLAFYLGTILLPTLMIRFYRKSQGWTHHQMGKRERRMVPYIISIVCYFMCYYLMQMMHVPHLISIILLIALFTNIICATINIWWKISSHTAGIGGVTGSVIMFSLMMGANLTWWICLCILLAGLVGTSRMMLRIHTLSQVVGGFIVGMFSSIFILFIV